MSLLYIEVVLRYLTTLNESHWTGIDDITTLLDICIGRYGTVVRV